MFELLGLIALGLPIALVVLIVVAIRQSGAISRLQSQVQGLEDRISRVETSPLSRDASVLNELRAEAVAVVTPPPVVETPEAVPDAQAPPSPEPPETTAEEPAAPPPPPALPKARFDWERFVGLRLPVWLGAIALSVAGFFFVSYAIESGFFTPEMRVLSAAAASVLFLAGAEFVRRRVRTGNVAAIASALAAASIATAYATAYLATKTYGLVPSGGGLHRHHRRQHRRHRHCADLW